jgi:hypothetical protein
VLIQVSIGPFDIIKSVSFTKERIIDSENESEYKPFIVNRGLSYFPDSIMYAQDMNVNAHLDPKLQYDYLFHGLRKRNRWSKWLKKLDDPNVKVVAEYLGLSHEKTRDAMKVMGPEKVKEILDRVSAGGKK